ncbi:UNVERIFIED_CONTAM: hypothetical protein FKN15_073488 [Acipenser sinensis]
MPTLHSNIMTSKTLQPTYIPGGQDSLLNIAQRRAGLGSTPCTLEPLLQRPYDPRNGEHQGVNCEDQLQYCCSNKAECDIREMLLQEWEQASAAPQSPEPEKEELLPVLPEHRGEELPLPEPRGGEPPFPESRGEEPPLPEPRGEESPLPEPRGEEPPLPEPRGEEPPLPEPRGEARSIPPPQPRPPPLRSSPAPLHSVPHPLLLDTLPVGLDLPSLDLEPRSQQNRSQFCTWSPAPLLPNTKTSLHCSQTSLKLPLGDRMSLHWVPAADLCPLLQPPVPWLSFRSPLTNRWGPSSPVCGPYLAGREVDRSTLKSARGRGRARTFMDSRVGGCVLEEGVALEWPSVLHT